MDQQFRFNRPLGYVQVAAGGLNAALTIASLQFPGQSAPGIPEGAQMLLLQPESQAIRMRDDGTAPTAAVGYPVAVGSEFQYTGALASLQVIAQAAGAALNVWAFG